MTANAPTNSGNWINNCADSFAGGTGTEDEPYLIETPQQLAWLGKLLRSGDTQAEYNDLYYEQIADIDMSDFYFYSLNQYALATDGFSGEFDGGGYSISNIFLKDQTSYWWDGGLFASINGARLVNINIVNIYMSPRGDAGGLVACAYDSIIENCSVTGEGSIEVLADGTINRVGGIVGSLSGDCSIINCFNSQDIVMEESAENEIYIGGIVGAVKDYGSTATISDSYNIGNLSFEGNYSSYMGGIVGSYVDNISSISISRCYNIGCLTGRYASSGGGIICELPSNGYIYDCYNRGTIDIGVASSKGGIVQRNRGKIYNCYATTKYSTEDLIVYNYGSIYNSVCSRIMVADVSEGVSSGNIVNCYTDENGELLKDYEFMSDEANWNSAHYWDFNGTWAYIAGENDGYPVLSSTMSYSITYHPNGASGDEVVESKVGSESYTIRSNMFTRSGYNFTGWNTQANGGGTSYSAGSSYSELANLDLYAQWSRITYTIKYNKNASDATGSMANTTKYYGTNVTLRSNAFKRTGYSFAGWATSSGGAVVYANGATYSANANVTLYAKWTAHKYTVKFNGNGSTSGSMNNQTFRYGTAQKLTSNAFKKTGFTFSKWTRNSDGTGTSYTNGQSVSNLTSSNGATINLYAQWKANNEAKYDSAGDYWYIENGKIPQTKVTNSTLISNLNKATTNGANYYIAGQTLTAKVYSGKEYCKWNNNWYEVEPIKWRLDASSSQKNGYGTTTDTNAVLAEIVYVDQYSSSSIDAGEGYSSQSVTDFMRNGISTTYLVNFEVSTQVFGNGTSLYGTSVFPRKAR